MTHPDSRRPQAVHLCAPGGLWAIAMVWAAVLQGEKPTAQSTDGKNTVAFNLIHFFPEFQTPSLYFPSYKKGQFKMEFKMVC